MKKVLIKGPIINRSGYGQHAVFAYRSLRQYLHNFDLYIEPTNWGKCGWNWEDDKERREIDALIQKTIIARQQGIQFDISLQVLTPPEWQNLASVNIGVTAGIETTKIAPEWINPCNAMNKIVTISEFAQKGFLNSEYPAHDQFGNEVIAKVNVPVDYVHYPVKNVPDVDLSHLKFKNDFNFLVIAQTSPRKNLENTIRWFVQEFIDQEVGLVLKLSIMNNSTVDREITKEKLQNILAEFPERKCSVTLLHGDMNDAEIHALYKHPQIKSLLSLSHGEGFGLPIFEAAYSGLPVVATNWSAIPEYMNMLDKKSGKMKPMFAAVEYDLENIQDVAVWNGMLVKESKWAFPKEWRAKLKMRTMQKNYNEFLSRAKKLQKHLIQNFKEADQYRKFASLISDEELAIPFDYDSVSISELPKISILTSVYDGDEFIEPFLQDIVSQTIFKDKCELILIDANSPGNEKEVIEKYQQQFSNILYERLKKDPGIYGVWNRAIQKSTGEFLTNANLDDRKKIDSLERHAKALYAHKDVSLVYADSLITREPNETFESNSSEGRKYDFQHASKEMMLRGNQPHNNPMWRKELHDRHGMFEEKYRSAGDWEMWLRCVFAGEKFMKLPECLGLYYFNPKGISTNFENYSWKKEEEREIYQKYYDLFSKLKEEK